MSVAVLQKCLYISNTYVEKYTRSRRLNNDMSIKEGWVVVGLEDRTYRKEYSGYKQVPSFYIPRTYKGLPIVGIIYRAGDSYFNEYGTAYVDSTPNVYYHEENMLTIQQSRVSYMQFYSDTNCSYLVWERCLMQYHIPSNETLSLLQNMAEVKGYDTTFRYASLGKLVIAYDKEERFWNGKTQTTTETANLTVVPVSDPYKQAEYRVGKYVSSDDSFRYWHKKVDADMRNYFDSHKSVFGWVKRAYGEKQITLPYFAMVSLNETSERIDVSDPEDPSTKYYT